MKQKRQKHSELLFTSYLDKDEYLIWVAAPKDNDFIRSRPSTCFNTILSSGMLIFSMIVVLLFINIAPLWTWASFSLFFLSFYTIFDIGRTYYAISNKRLFILKIVMFKHLSTEPLSHLQEIRINEDDYNRFSLNFAPLTLTYGKNQGIRQDFPISFDAKKIEGLSQEDAQAAYDLLMAEREERAEELDLLD